MSNDEHTQPSIESGTADDLTTGGREASATENEHEHEDKPAAIAAAEAEGEVVVASTSDGTVAVSAAEGDLQEADHLGSEPQLAEQEREQKTTTSPGQDLQQGAHADDREDTRDRSSTSVGEHQSTDALPGDPAGPAADGEAAGDDDTKLYEAPSRSTANVVERTAEEGIRGTSREQQPPSDDPRFDDGAMAVPADESVPVERSASSDQRPAEGSASPVVTPASESLPAETTTFSAINNGSAAAAISTASTSAPGVRPAATKKFTSSLSMNKKFLEKWA